MDDGRPKKQLERIGIHWSNDSSALPPSATASVELSSVVSSFVIFVQQEHKSEIP
jgi:hypothetical protein